MDVLTDKRGTVLQSQSFDAWGQRRASEDWRALTSGQLVTFDTGLTRCGYTDHEHLDSMGLIHMNGRVYDPKLARFIQADPIIQAAGHTQSYNRYSYVLNNPLNATDPSGYIFSSLWKEIRPFVGAIVAVGLTIMCHPCGLVAMTAIGGVSGAAGAAANGGNILRGAALGAFSAWAASGGGWMGAAVAGGFSAAALGGDARGGFAAAGIGAYMGGVQGDWSFVAAAVGGGLASEVTGGKFANGAATAAFMWALRAGAEAAYEPSLSEDEALARHYEKDPKLKADREAAKKAIEALYTDGTLSDSQRFASLNKAALHVTKSTEGITKGFDLEVGGYLFEDDAGMIGYSHPVVGTRSRVPLKVMGHPSTRIPSDTKLAGWWHNHPSGSRARFSGGDIGFTRSKGIQVDGFVYSDTEGLLSRYIYKQNAVCTVNSAISSYAPQCPFGL